MIAWKAQGSRRYFSTCGRWEVRRAFAKQFVGCTFKAFDNGQEIGEAKSYASEAKRICQAKADAEVQMREGGQSGREVVLRPML